jgi:hypothetical protein
MRTPVGTGPDVEKSPNWHLTIGFFLGCPHDRPCEVKLAFTDTYIKRDGRWQVWASQHTRIRP